MNFIVELGLFPFQIMFSFDESNERLKSRLKKCGLEYNSKMDIEKHCKGITIFDDENYTTLIRMPNLVVSPTDYGTLSHEIYHSVCFILRASGVELCDSTEEVFAYCISDITQKVIAKIEKLNLKCESTQKNNKKE